MSKKQRAFTLIELVVVVVIIAVLAVVAFVAYSSAKAKSRDSKRKTDLSTIMSAILIYSDANNKVLPATGEGYIKISGGNLNSVVSGGYLDKIPCDPLGCSVSTTGYSGYNYQNTSGNPFLYAGLEKPTTQDLNTINSDNIANIKNIYCSDCTERAVAKYNYKLTSQ